MTRDILDHLYTMYANILSTDLRNNDKDMKDTYDRDLSKVLIKQIKDAVEFDAAESTQYTAKQVFNIAYQLVYETGIFAEDCKL